MSARRMARGLHIEETPSLALETQRWKATESNDSFDPFCHSNLTQFFGCGLLPEGLSFCAETFRSFAENLCGAALRKPVLGRPSSHAVQLYFACCRKPVIWIVPSADRLMTE